MYDHVYNSPRSPPKNTLKIAWTKRRIDTSSKEARESSVVFSRHRETCSPERVDDGNAKQHWETSSKGESCPDIDFRVQCLLNSTVEQQDTTRKIIVENLVHQTETHPYREALKADLQQNQDYNQFSEEAKDMIHDLGNVAYSEMCEISPTIQCSLCLAYCARGIVYCRCGYCMEPTNFRWKKTWIDLTQFRFQIV